MFTQEELNNLGAFMSRVDLKGTESELHALLMQKIKGLLKPVEPKAEPTPKK